MMSPTMAQSSMPNPNRHAVSFYEQCITMYDRLSSVPALRGYLTPEYLVSVGAPESAIEDPVALLWYIFRIGNILAVIMNFNNVDKKIPINPQNSLSTLQTCKKVVFPFMVACRKIMPQADMFTLRELYEEDANGFVKVVHVVSLVLDYLEENGHINTKEPQLPNRFSQSGSGGGPEDHRAKIVFELLNTEKLYVRDLEQLYVYQREIQGKDLLAPEITLNIFGNLKSIVDFQRKFSFSIEAAAHHAPQEQMFGTLFVQMEKEFACYEPFCANYPYASGLFLQVKDRLTQFPQIMDPGYGLFSLLIKPVQRITKYRLLLKELVKKTDKDAPNYKDLNDGFEAVQRITLGVNEATRKRENQTKADDLIARVKDWKEYDVNSFGELLLDDKFAMATGEVERGMIVYLFERILIFCKDMGPNKKNKGPSQLQLKGHIYITSVTGVEDATIESSFLLKVLWKDNEEGRFLLKCISKETLNRWKTAIEKLIKDLTEQTNAQQNSQSGIYVGEGRSSTENQRPHRLFPAQHKETHITNSSLPSIPEDQRRHGSSESDIPHRGRPRNILIDTVSTELPKLTGMVKIKIDYQEDVYQIMVPNSITFTALMEKVEKKIRMCLGKPKDEEIHLKVRYIDEDGDYVTIKTNEDIQTSFKGRDSSLPYTVLNLYVNEV